MNPTEKEIRIGVSNVERLVFHDEAAWRTMPEMRRFREQWAFSMTSPHLRPTGKAALIDFLDSAGPDQERALSEHFGAKITIDRVDRRSVASVDFRAGEPADLSEFSEYTGFSAHRRGDRVSVTFWR